MNIEQAKNISIAGILSKINILPVRETESEAYYLSPIRNERTASFHLDKAGNRWYDHGIGEGGDIVNLVCLYLKYHKENHTVADALRWIEIMSGNATAIKPITYIPFQTEKSFVLKSAEPLHHRALFNYLTARGIDLNIAVYYLETVKVFNKKSGKYITSLGFKNDNDGYELRNKAFKGCVGSKYITFIRGTNPDSSGIHLFEGFMDFLSILTIKGERVLKDDVIVLNSLVCLEKATPYIKDYGYKVAYTWMDNDIPGTKATNSLSEFFKTQKELQHKPMNKIYTSNKDVNSWHMFNHNLAL